MSCAPAQIGNHEAVNLTGFIRRSRRRHCRRRQRGAAGLRGQRRLRLDQGLAFRARPALARLCASEALAGYLGPEYPRLYAVCKTEEPEAFERHIGAREYAWYLQPE